MFINNNSNKGISAPIAILVIMVAAVIGGGLVLWQYSEMEKETTDVSEIKKETKERVDDLEIEDNEIKIDDAIIEDKEDKENEESKESEKENMDLSIEKVSLEKRVGEDGKTRLYYDTVIKNVGNVSVEHFEIEYTLYNDKCTWYGDEDAELGHICGKNRKEYQPPKAIVTKKLSPGEFYYDTAGFINYGNGLHTVKIVIDADSNKENNKIIEEIFIEQEERSLSVVYPNGIEKFQKGGEMEIEWEQTGFEDENTISIYLWAYDDSTPHKFFLDSKKEYGSYDQENGYSYIIKKNVLIDNEKIVWTIPDDISQRFVKSPDTSFELQVPAVYYRIYIEYREHMLSYICDVSDDYFTIN